MDVNHYNELIELSQEIYDQATEKLSNYIAAKYCAVENSTTEQQLEDYLFITEEFRNLDCRSGVTSAAALSRLTS